MSEAGEPAQGYLSDVGVIAFSYDGETLHLYRRADDVPADHDVKGLVQWVKLHRPRKNVKPDPPKQTLDEWLASATPEERHDFYQSAWK